VRRGQSAGREIGKGARGSLKNDQSILENPRKYSIYARKYSIYTRKYSIYARKCSIYTFPSSTHDYTIYQKSGLVEILAAHARTPQGRALALYGDPPYRSDDHMLIAIQGANPTAADNSSTPS
jgi:hypothetical protein